MRVIALTTMHKTNKLHLDARAKLKRFFHFLRRYKIKNLQQQNHFFLHYYDPRPTLDAFQHSQLIKTFLLLGRHELLCITTQTPF